MKRWSDRKLWQWVIHVAIGFSWSFVGASVIWIGAPVFTAFITGFYAAVVGATMKEATDQTVYAALQETRSGHGLRDIGKVVCDELDWHGWDWKDFMQHVIGGFIAPWIHIGIWWVV